MFSKLKHFPTKFKALLSLLTLREYEKILLLHNFLFRQTDIFKRKAYLFPSFLYQQLWPCRPTKINLRNLSPKISVRKTTYLLSLPDHTEASCRSLVHWLQSCTKN